MLLTAAPAITPSGVPPTPHSRSTPVPGRTAISTPATSPSVISRMRAPAARMRAMPSSWRGRSSTTTIRSPTCTPRRSAMRRSTVSMGSSSEMQVGDVVAAGHLLHVEARPGVEHRAALRERDDRERVGLALGAQRRPLQRVDGDVDLRRRAVADALAVVEHRGLVLLALADDHDAVHRDGRHHVPHRVDGRLVGGVLVAAPDPARGGQRRGLGDTDEFEGEVAIRRLALHASDRRPAAARRLATLRGDDATCSHPSTSPPLAAISRPSSARSPASRRCTSTGPAARRCRGR